MIPGPSVETLEAILALVRQRRGFDLGEYRRSVLDRRLRARLQRLRLSTFEEYLGHLEESPDEAKELVRHVMINASRFFRDRRGFELIRDTVLAPWARERRGRPFRAWSAGCANGEEAFTLAFVASEAGSGLEFSIRGTDVDEQAIDAARAAAYPEWAVEGLRPEEIERYFSVHRGDPRRKPYLVKEQFRRNVRFDREGLLRTAEPVDEEAKPDLILCRNVLIYFTKEAQARVQRRLFESLAPSGHLWLGEAEVLSRELQQEFEVVDKRARLYRAL